MRRAPVGRAAPLAVLVWLLACDASTSEPEPRVVAQEARYRVTAAPAPDDRLELRVEPTGGWHIAPEAPARLTFPPHEGVRFEPAELTSEQALALSADELAFGTRLHLDAPAPASVRARLKFGICEGPKEKCVIVRRELEIPLAGS